MRNGMIVFCVGLLILPAIVGCGGPKNNGKSLTEEYQEALALPNADGRARALIRVAKKQENAGDRAGAERSLDDATNASDEVTDPAPRAGVFNALADAQAKTGLFGDAKRSLKEVRKACEDESIDAEQKVIIYSKMAVTYGAYLKKKENAETYLEMAADLAVGVESPLGKVSSLMTVAEEFQKLDMASEADKLVTQSLEVAKSISDPRDQADAIASIASSLGQMGKEDQARTTFDEAIGTAEKIEDIVSKAHALADLAPKLAKVGRKSDARELLKKAAAAADKITGDKGLQNEVREKIDSYKREM